ncbi:hypothetical protein [Bdellovibrio sp.]|uniref:hypothetical protein n=1 Tax=Bdellovibrio TaxID=958 RepID=UPI0032221086
MKTRVLVILLAASLVWAGSVTYLYWQLKNNPRVVAITMDAGKESLQNVQLGEMERMTFLRQYLERYFNYDSNNFWQSQTSLAFLMSPKLSEERIREVSRLREKIQQKNLSQAGRLLSLKQVPDGSYQAELHLRITENAQKNDLYIKTQIRLSNTERTLENPWGLVVSSMQLSSAPTAPEFTALVRVGSQSPTLLTFPCAIENIENPRESDLKIKITTLNISELQITPTKTFTGPVSLLASCKGLEFKFDLVTEGKEKDLFVAFPESAGTVRRKEVVPGKVHKKDIYEKTIENVLGIELDQ